MLIKNIDKYDMKKEFKKYDRDYYSLEGYQAIIDYFEGLGDYELDVIAICCEFTEYTRTELLQDYDMDLDEIEENTYCVCVSDKSDMLEMLYRRLYEENKAGNKEKALEFVKEINRTDDKYLVQNF